MNAFLLHLVICKCEIRFVINYQKTDWPIDFRFNGTNQCAQNFRNRNANCFLRVARHSTAIKNTFLSIDWHIIQSCSQWPSSNGNSMRWNAMDFVNTRKNRFSWCQKCNEIRANIISTPRNKGWLNFARRCTICRSNKVLYFSKRIVKWSARLNGRGWKWNKSTIDWIPQIISFTSTSKDYNAESDGETWERDVYEMGMVTITTLSELQSNM